MDLDRTHFTHDEKIELLKNIRVDIDASIKTVGPLRDTFMANSVPEDGVRELEKAYTKLQEAKMWIGKVMEAIGSELPKEFRDEAK